MRKQGLFSDFITSMGWAVLFYSVTEILKGVISVIISAHIGDITNNVLIYNSSDLRADLLTVIWGFFGMVFVIPFFDWLGEITMFRKSFEYCNSVFGAFLRNEYSNVQRLTIGEAEYRLEDDTIGFYCNMTIHCKYAISLPIVCGYFANSVSNMNRILIFTMVCLAIVSAVIPILVSGKREYLLNEIQLVKMKIRSDEISLASQPEEYITLGITDKWLRRIQRIYSNNIFLFKKWNKVNGGVRYFTEGILSCSEVILVILGSVLVTKGKSSIGEVTLMALVLPLFRELIRNLYEFTISISEIRALGKRMNVIYSGQEYEVGQELTEIGDIDVENVSVSYNGDGLTFAPVSFSVRKGEKVLIVGKNGTGKTSVMNLLSGLEMDHLGKIFINGIDIDSVNRVKLRKKITYITQNPIFFKGTVEDNIRLGNMTVSLERVNEICRMLGIEYLLERKDSITEQKLSGGEKQKVSLSRGFIRDTELYIFDEPGNQLDETTLMNVKEAILRLKKTVIVISHDKRFLDDRFRKISF